MENVKYVVLLYKYDVVEVGDLFVILHIYNKILSYKKVLVLCYCAPLKAIRYKSTSFNRIVADKLHHVIAA